MISILYERDTVNVYKNSSSETNIENGNENNYSIEEEFP